MSVMSGYSDDDALLHAMCCRVYALGQASGFRVIGLGWGSRDSKLRVCEVPVRLSPVTEKRPLS